MNLTTSGFRRLWIAIIVLAALVIVASSLLPLPAASLGGGRDKLGHFVAYFVLMALGAGISPDTRLWQVALRCLLLGIALEVAQAALPGIRQADWADLLANATGVLAAWLIASGERAGWARHIEAWLARRLGH